MDERRIDLSALDPGRDPERLERMVRAVLARAEAPPPHPLASSLVARGRTAVIAAAVLAVVAWIPVLAVRRSAPAAPASTDPVATLASWARDGAVPGDADLYRVLGVNDDR